MSDKGGEFISALDAATVLEVAVGTVYNWAKSGRLPSYRSGERWLFKKSEVEEMRDALQPRPFEPDANETEVVNGRT